VWDMLDSAYAHFGVFPTLLERDFNIPPLAQLLTEVDQIRSAQASWQGNNKISGKTHVFA